MIERHVVANLGGLANNHAHAMIDKETLADDGAGMNFDAREESANVRNETPDQLPIVDPGPMAQVIKLQRVETGVAEHDFGTRAHRGVAPEDNIDIGSNPLEHIDTRRLVWRAVRPGRRHPRQIASEWSYIFSD